MKPVSLAVILAALQMSVMYASADFGDPPEKDPCEFMTKSRENRTIARKVVNITLSTRYGYHNNVLKVLEIPFCFIKDNEQV